MPRGDEFDAVFDEFMRVANRYPDLFVVVVVSPRAPGRQTVASATTAEDPYDADRLLEAALVAGRALS